jgi:hypothetical protein
LLSACAVFAIPAAVALLYGLITTHTVTVINGPAEQVARDQLAFATPAAVAEPFCSCATTAGCCGSSVRSCRCS